MTKRETRRLEHWVLIIVWKLGFGHWDLRD